MTLSHWGNLGPQTVLITNHLFNIPRDRDRHSGNGALTPGKKIIRFIKVWLSRKACTRHELESLIGHLRHACRVVRPGQTFLYWLLQLKKRTKKPHYFVRIDRKFRSDLLLWNTFLGSWNGTSMIFESKANQPDEELWSGASGSWGCGALWGGEWFQQSWVNIPQGKPSMDSIASMELLPIVIAAAVWGLKWAGCTVVVTVTMKWWYWLSIQGTVSTN